MIKLYGVGTGKSGTHSVAEMFATHHRAAHEAEAKELMELLFERWEGRAEPDLQTYLVERDRRLRLDVDASLVLGEVAAELAALSPQARFLLTIRDPWSWLESMFNHSLSRPTPKNWVRWREHRYRASELRHPSEERVLARKGLYTLDGYLGAWAAHNDHVLSSVPSGRLLVVRTDQLSERIEDVAGFVEADPSTIEAERSHAFAAAGDHDVLRQIDAGYLHQRVLAHGRHLVERFFPERL